MTKKFYVYVHRYASGPKVGKIFYVGKGRLQRSKIRSGRNDRWNKIVNKYGFSDHIIAEFDSETCALSYEMAMIESLGISNLCNMTAGGEGVSGLVHSDKAKKKMSENRTNNPWLKGKEVPEWIKEKLRQAKLGKAQSFEHAQKSRTNKIGVKIADTSKFNLDKQKSVRNCSGEVFISAAEAAREMSKWLNTNASQGNITMCVRGKRKTAYGQKWSYFDATA
jgi:hypothetical protein